MGNEYDKLFSIINKAANSVSYNKNKFNNQIVLDEIFSELKSVDKTNEEKLNTLKSTLKQRIIDNENNWRLSANYKEYYQILETGLNEISKGNRLPDFHVTRPYEWFRKIKNPS